MPDGLSATLLLPSVVLSILVGVFQASAYLVIVRRIGWQTIATFALAIVGAWVGDALLGPGSVLRLGDYSLLWGSIGAWVAIGVVEGSAWYLGRRRAAALADRPAARTDGS